MDAAVRFTPEDLRDLASYFAAKSVIAADAATQTEDEGQARDHLTSSRTWALAADVVSRAAAAAPPKDPEAEKPPYYGKDGMVWKRPVITGVSDGITTIEIGFPVCRMHEAVGADAAGMIAALMNLGDRHQKEIAHG